MSSTCENVFGVGSDLCKVAHNYCERGLSDALNGEPLNAITNAAFLVAAWAAWRLLKKNPDAQPRGLIRLLIATLAIIGLGSFLFHTVATGWAEWGDVYPILAFLVLYLWIVLTYLLEMRLIERLVALALVFVPAYFAEAVSRGHADESDPIVKALWSGALYVPIVIALVVLGLALLQRRPQAGNALFAATAVWLISLTVRTLDMQLCPSFPFGTHFVWHMINAIVLFLFTRIVILYSGPSSRRAAS